MRAGPAFFEVGGAGGLLLRMTSKIFVVSEKDGLVVAMAVVPGEGGSVIQIDWQSTIHAYSI